MIEEVFSYINLQNLNALLLTFMAFVPSERTYQESLG